jgi:SAM-dependent methyltransferase
VTLFRRAYLRFAVSPDPFRFDPRLDRLVRRLCSQADRDRRVLNLGSGMTTYGPGTVNLDLEPFDGVSVCGDGQQLPFRQGSFAGVIIRGVLEHVRYPEEVRKEVARVLGPGGFVYIEVPFLQPLHLSPEDHRRFTLPGLRFYLQDFEELESGVQIGPGSTLAWVLREVIGTLLSFGRARAYPKMLTLAGWATFWIKYLDLLVVPAPHVANCASAIYYLGRKRG